MKIIFKKFFDILNQFHFKQNDFREFLFHFHKIIIDKNEIIKFLYKFKLII